VQKFQRVALIESLRQCLSSDQVLA
jgi:hypothetical protein